MTRLARPDDDFVNQEQYQVLLNCHEAPVSIRDLVVCNLDSEQHDAG